MKKILLALLAPFILLANTHIPIDERITDIYFINELINSQHNANPNLNSSLTILNISSLIS